MAKLIKLPDGPYIKADAVTSVGDVWENEYVSGWNYNVYYNNHLDEPNCYTVRLNEKFVKDEDKAKDWQSRFIETVNNNL